MPKINIYSPCFCNSGKIYKYCCSLIIYEPTKCHNCHMIIKYNKCYQCERLNILSSLRKNN